MPDGTPIEDWATKIGHILSEETRASLKFKRALANLVKNAKLAKARTPTSDKDATPPTTRQQTKTSTDKVSNAPTGNNPEDRIRAQEYIPGTFTVDPANFPF